jgi:hypothetical protein
LPAFVRADLEGYVKCGALNRGFAHLQCEGCGRPVLVAFSCGSRGFCRSCLGRRMCQGALNLLTYVLPAVPLRQWVLTLPFELRAPLAYERDALAEVGFAHRSQSAGGFGEAERSEGEAGWVAGAECGANPPRVPPRASPSRPGLAVVFAPCPSFPTHQTPQNRLRPGQSAASLKTRVHATHPSADHHLPGMKLCTTIAGP